MVVFVWKLKFLGQKDSKMKCGLLTSGHAPVKGIEAGIPLSSR